MLKMLTFVYLSLHFKTRELNKNIRQRKASQKISFRMMYKTWPMNFLLARTITIDLKNKTEYNRLFFTRF